MNTVKLNKSPAKNTAECGDIFHHDSHGTYLLCCAGSGYTLVCLRSGGHYTSGRETMDKLVHYVKSQGFKNLGAGAIIEITFKR